MIFILLSCLIQNHLLREDTAHSGMGSPTSTIIQENAPQICIQVILIEAFSHIILAVSNWQTNQTNSVSIILHYQSLLTNTVYYIHHL